MAGIAITAGVGPVVKTRQAGVIGGDHAQLFESAPASTVTTSKVTVTTASTQIVAANANRRVAIIHVVSGGPVYISSGTATVDGFPLTAGGVYEHENTSALNGIVASGSADVRVLEEA